ncbi:hypothetical protein IWX49DRAFT_207612 [Phyllosticta citricarpa]|uniref:Secreted protein n=1 Tax=Phyllosticta citricarpa TaxID=55181 RepID=A0ABR1MFZ8_9PEZI
MLVITERLGWISLSLSRPVSAFGGGRLWRRRTVATAAVFPFPCHIMRRITGTPVVSNQASISHLGQEGPVFNQTNNLIFIFHFFFFFLASVEVVCNWRTDSLIARACARRL